jgi:tubulin---tyrosine ligase
MEAAVDELRVAVAYFLASRGGGVIVRPSPQQRPAATPQPQPLYSGRVDVECPYTRRHLEACFARRPWWRTDGGPDAPLQFVEYEAVDWDAVLKPPHQVTNNLMVRKGLCRKANFARSMARHVARCGSGCPLAAAIPPTAVIDTVPVFHDRPPWLDFRAAMADALCEADDLMTPAAAGAAAAAPSGGDALWILKPSLANKAAGISIVRSLAEVDAAVKAERDVGQWVLQAYVDRPLLVGGGRKFHLRVYALADGALDVHVLSQALVLLAVEPYARNDTAAVHAHITNTCVGVEHGGFDEGAHVRTLSELPGMLVAEGAVADAAEGEARVAALRAGIAACVAHAFSAFESDVGGRAFMPLPHAWELYGLDFLVTSDWGLALLEANPTPDIRQTGGRLDGVIADLLEGVVRTCVDRRFPPPPAAAALPPLGAVWERVYSKPWPAAAAAARAGGGGGAAAAGR